jgi:anaerobic ribonucleoside-triphosphate reductase activating protein
MEGIIVELIIHDIIEESRANGPGKRFVIYFQGCPFKCEGCINPSTHDPNGGYLLNIDNLMERIKKKANTIEGVTITGGEPFLQSNALNHLVSRIKKLGLSVIVSTGYEHKELIEEVANFNSIKKNCDVIIAGRFHHEDLIGIGLIGSANKNILLFTNVYSVEDILNTPKMELHISSNAIKATGTGIYELFDWSTF